MIEAQPTRVPIRQTGNKIGKGEAAEGSVCLPDEQMPGPADKICRTVVDETESCRDGMEKYF